MQKTIKFRIPVTIVIGGSLPWSFLDCVKHLACTCDEFCHRNGARAADRLINAIMATGDGAECEVYVEDLTLLDKAFEAPPSGYCPKLSSNGKEYPVGAHQFVAYMDAVSQP